jgi:hypothetical protein
MGRGLGSPTWVPRHTTCTKDTVLLLGLRARGFLLTATGTPATRDRDQAMVAPPLMDLMEVTAPGLEDLEASIQAILHHRASTRQLRVGMVPVVPLAREVPLLLQANPADPR